MFLCWMHGIQHRMVLWDVKYCSQRYRRMRFLSSCITVSSFYAICTVLGVLHSVLLPQSQFKRKKIVMKVIIKHIARKHKQMWINNNWENVIKLERRGGERRRGKGEEGRGVGTLTLGCTRFWPKNLYVPYESVTGLFVCLFMFWIPCFISKSFVVKLWNTRMFFSF